MPFILAKKREIEWPVSIEVPIDGGRTESQKCTASFEVLNQNSPRLSKGLPEREDSLEDGYWEL